MKAGDDAQISCRVFDLDSARASAEYLAQFRSDVEGFVSREVIDAAVVAGRYELPLLSAASYVGFAELSAFFKSYHVHRITTDHWGGEFPVEQFRKHGVTCEVSKRIKNDIYKELLPQLNSGKIELLDNSRLIGQLVSLERRTARGRKDSIDHAPGAHDDIVNSVAGALVAADAKQPMKIPAALLTKLKARDMQRKWRRDHGWYG